MAVGGKKQTNGEENVRVHRDKPVVTGDVITGWTKERNRIYQKLIRKETNTEKIIYKPR